ncbi:MAG: DNA polymerase III subunit beta [Candidatus Spechtbacterales bacterium]
MELLIKKDLFLKGINLTEKNIGRNLSLPVLNNVLIKTEKNSLKIISTDLEMAVSVNMPAKIEKEGSITVQPRVLSGFLNNLSDENLHIKTEKNTLFIEQGDYKIKLNGEDDKEFPILPKVNKINTIEINTQDFIKSLGQVINSVASSELKPELTGVFFSITKNGIKLAATDSFRLAEKTINHETSMQGDFKFILPAKTVQEIIRSFQDNEGQLLLFVDKNQVVIQNKSDQKINIQLISKLIEGDYPEYTQIIPKEFKTRSIVAKKDFIQQVKAANIFTSRINDVKLNISGKKIEIESENNDIGKFHSSVNAAIEGENKEVSFNCQYLLDGLNNIEGDEILFKVNNNEGPTLLESSKHKDYFYVLMPIRGN